MRQKRSSEGTVHMIISAFLSVRAMFLSQQNTISTLKLTIIYRTRYELFLPKTISKHTGYTRKNYRFVTKQWIGNKDQNASNPSHSTGNDGYPSIPRASVVWEKCYTNRGGRRILNAQDARRTTKQLSIFYNIQVKELVNL